MNLAHYPIRIPYDALAENLVNSHDVSIPEPEHLRGVEDLRRLMRHHGLEPGKTTARDVLKARAVRAAARRVFESRDPGQAMRQISSLLEDKRYVPRLSMHDGAVELGWLVESQRSAGARLEAAVALNLAALLQTLGFERFRICRARPCQDVFVDISKRGSRIFCGPRCATRVHVARFRERQ